MKILLFLLFSILVNTSNAQEFKEGDIIFQTSQSKQSPLIAYATMSNKTHCGIIVEKDSKIYVLETLGTIKLTPIQTFIDRGLFKKYWVKRYTDDKLKVNYEKYLGIKYDLAFKFNNEKYYCSELVYSIYKNDFNIELCKTKQLKEYNLLGIRDQAKRRGMDEEQFVVSPSDIFESKYLKTPDDSYL